MQIKDVHTREVRVPLHELVERSTDPDGVGWTTYDLKDLKVVANPEHPEDPFVEFTASKQVG